MKVFLIFVALFGVTVADLAEFTKCEEYSDDICEVTEVRVTPCKNHKYCKLRKGQESSIEFDFIPKFTADKLTTSLFWASPNGDVLYDDFANIDACPYTRCPTQSGTNQTLAYSLRLKKILPNGSFTFKWKLWDASADDKTCCFKTEVLLRK